MKKGRYFFLKGHVENMLDKYKNECYFLKSTVMARYEVKMYHVTITFDIKVGKVLDTSCDCRASAMCRCNHLAALLFALEDYVIQFGNDPPSYTSKLCQWNVGRKTKRTTKPVTIVSQKNKK